MRRNKSIEKWMRTVFSVWVGWWPLVWRARCPQRPCRPNRVRTRESPFDWFPNAQCSHLFQSKILAHHSHLAGYACGTSALSRIAKASKEDWLGLQLGHVGPDTGPDHAGARNNCELVGILACVKHLTLACKDMDVIRIGHWAVGAPDVH